MDLFGKFRKLDSALQRGLDNSFARVFGGEVVPTEIDELLKQQAEDSVMVDSEGNRLAPSYFLVTLSQRDFDSLQENHPSLIRDLSTRLARFIRNEGWTTNNQVTVDLKADEEMHTGQLKTDSRFKIPESYTPPAEPAAQESAAQAEPSPSSSSSDSGSPEWPQTPHQSREVEAQDYDADADSDVFPSQSAPAVGPSDSPDAAAAAASGLGSVVRPSPGTGYSEQSPGAGAGEDPSPSPAATESESGEEGVQSYPGTTVITHAANDEAPVRGGTGEPHPEEATRTVTLILQDGSDRRYELVTGSNLIGRGNTVDLRIPDTGVSRQHAEITWDGYDAVLTDLESTNGTSVNGTPIENWLLADGDVIAIGHSEIAVSFQN